MEQLIEMAKRLGSRIVAHERTTLLRKSQKQVNDDTKALELIEAYQHQALKIHQLEEQQKPIEVEDKRKLQDLEQQIGTDAKLAELTRRQADFVEMMHKVKAAIDEQLKLED